MGSLTRPRCEPLCRPTVEAQEALRAWRRVRKRSGSCPGASWPIQKLKLPGTPHHARDPWLPGFASYRDISSDSTSPPRRAASSLPCRTCLRSAPPSRDGDQTRRCLRPRLIAGATSRQHCAGVARASPGDLQAGAWGRRYEQRMPQAARGSGCGPDDVDFATCSEAANCRGYGDGNARQLFLATGPDVFSKHLRKLEPCSTTFVAQIPCCVVPPQPVSGTPELGRTIHAAAGTRGVGAFSLAMSVLQRCSDLWKSQHVPQIAGSASYRLETLRGHSAQLPQRMN
jgi:hypothetical protein